MGRRCVLAVLGEEEGGLEAVAVEGLGQAWGAEKAALGVVGVVGEVAL